MQLLGWLVPWKISYWCLFLLFAYPAYPLVGVYQCLSLIACNHQTWSLLCSVGALPRLNDPKTGQEHARVKVHKSILTFWPQPTSYHVCCLIYRLVLDPDDLIHESSILAKAFLHGETNELHPVAATSGPEQEGLPSRGSWICCRYRQTGTTLRSTIFILSKTHQFSYIYIYTHIHVHICVSRYYRYLISQWDLFFQSPCLSPEELTSKRTSIRSSYTPTAGGSGLLRADQLKKLSNNHAKQKILFLK